MEVVLDKEVESKRYEWKEMGQMYYIKPKKIEEEKPTLRLLAFGLYQEMLLTRLSRRQGLVQDHCKNEHEEKTVLGLHDASDQPLLPDHPFQLANDDFQLLFKFDPPSLLYGSIKNKLDI